VQPVKRTVAIIVSLFIGDLLDWSLLKRGVLN
jgi:hypothetical protein